MLKGFREPGTVRAHHPTLLPYQRHARPTSLFSTFHAHYPVLRWPLDHVFSSEHFTLRDMQRLPGSDHFPILTTLCYRPSRADEHETPDAMPQYARERRGSRKPRQKRVP
ncbi:endonuclease/exonuclease/phosphatase family protein [Halomonas elongata]|uniref:endonuclease/exonuclease/phosphatase family protein n=1 Tax=Halomonas elongata TaxID=2746 RepID=UPI0038D394F8